jgi:DNA polymerase III delta subunit
MPLRNSAFQKMQTPRPESCIIFSKARVYESVSPKSSKRSATPPQDKSAEESKTNQPTKSGGVKLSPDGLLKQLKTAANTLAQRSNLDPISALAQSGISSPIILLGTQHIRAKRTIDWIRENFFPSESASFGSYFGSQLTSESSLAHIKSSLANLSLFAKAELVVIYEADKVKAALANSLLAAIERGQGGALLILTAEAANQKAALLAKLGKVGTVVEFSDLDASTLRRWIEKEVARHTRPGHKDGPAGIAPDALELLIKCYGSDVSALAREISKLSLLTPAGEKIPRALVEQLSLRTPEATSFALINEMAKRNAPASVALTKTIVEQGLHPLQVNAFLSRCIRTMLAQVDKTASSGLAPELNNPWFLRNLTPAVNAFSLVDLESSLTLLTKLDFQLKDSKLPDTLVLSNTVQRIALRAFDQPLSCTR